MKGRGAVSLQDVLSSRARRSISRVLRSFIRASRSDFSGKDYLCFGSYRFIEE